MINRYQQQSMLRSYYRALVIVRMRAAGHTLKTIAEYFLITPERVRQICWRGPVAAQLSLPTNQEQTP